MKMFQTVGRLETRHDIVTVSIKRPSLKKKPSRNLEKLPNTEREEIVQQTLTKIPAKPFWKIPQVNETPRRSQKTPVVSPPKPPIPNVSLPKKSTEGTRNFWCLLCNIAHTSKSLLLLHLKSSHNVNLYKCDFCDEEFADSNFRERHITDVHVRFPTETMPGIQDMDQMEQDIEQEEIDHMDTNADDWQTDNDEEWVPKVLEKPKRHRILSRRISSKSPKRLEKPKIEIKATPTMFGKRRGRPTKEMVMEWKKRRVVVEPMHDEERLDLFEDDEGEVENAWWAKPKELPDPTKVLKDKNKMCHICGEMRVTLTAHLRKMHTNYTNCPQCSGKITEGSTVPHQCPKRRPNYKCTCGLDYNVREHMHGHLLEKNSSKHEIQCHSCDDTFRDFGQYHDHLDIVHPAPFICNVCGKRFTKKNNLKSHMYSIHVIEKPVMKCEICGAECRGERNMKRHVMHVHRKATRINCDICKISIFDKVSLRRHMMYKHGLKKEYVCNVCKREFATADALRYHITTHTGDRPYPCPFCPKKFKINSELRKHYRAHKELTIKCPSCSLYCLNEEDLRKHIRRFPAHDVKFLIE